MPRGWALHKTGPLHTPTELQHTSRMVTPRGKDGHWNTYPNARKVEHRLPYLHWEERLSPGANPLPTAA
jgi:hypothetical protein